MFRKIILLICIAFVVVCYGYPCLILPFGNYNYKYENLKGEEQVATIKFNFDGTVTYSDADLEDEQIFNYKLKGNKIIVSEDETFDDSDMEIKLKNIYEFDTQGLLESKTYKNNIGMYVSIGVGALAIIMILTAPNKSKRRR